MLKFILLFLGLTAVMSVHAAMNSKEVQAAKSLEERVAELEANQALNIFTFNGIFETRYDNIDTANYKDLDYLRMRFSLDVNANISKNIQFYSRFTTVKFFNRWYQQGTESDRTSDLNSADDYSKSRGDMVLEKAYVDFTMPNPNWVISLGRLPTVDGPPTNFWDGRARMGTYPLLTYNSILDGVAATYKWTDFMPEHQHLAFRALYTPFSQYNVGSESQPAYTTPPTNSTNERLKTLASITSLQADFSHDDPGFADNVDVIAQYFQSDRFNYLGSLDIQVGGTTLMVETNSLFHTGFDASYSILFSNFRSVGYATTAGTGFGTSQDDLTSHGYVSLLSTRYRFNDIWFVGAEWIEGSRASFYYAGASEDMTGLYSTRGEAYHFYVTYKFQPNLDMRVGWSQQDPRYSEPQLGVSPQRGLGTRIDTYYAKMRLDF